MNLNFSKLIGDIENELELHYLPGAIRWIDEKYDGAWSKAIERFDHALSSATGSKYFEAAKLEGEIYKDTILRLIKKYKEHKNGTKVIKYLEGKRIEGSL